MFWHRLIKVFIDKYLNEDMLLGKSIWELSFTVIVIPLGVYIFSTKETLLSMLSNKT